MHERRVVVPSVCAMLLLACGTAAAQSRQPPAASGRPSPVSREISAAIAPGCSYHARVRGTVQSVKVDDETFAYRPNLNVETWLDCGGRGATARHETARLQPTEPMSREDLEREILRRSLVAVRHEQMVCILAPHFTFDGQRLGGSELAGLCGHRGPPPPAIGGGPAPIEGAEGVQHL